MNEKSAEVEGIQADQGWSDDTVMMLALRFIAEQGLDDKFDGYVRQIADHENAECDGNEDEDEDESN